MLKESFVKTIEKEVLGFEYPGYVLWNFGNKYTNKKFGNIDKLENEFKNLIQNNYQKLQSNISSRSKQS